MRLLPTAALLLAFPLLAQQAPIPDQPFAESIDVSVANVEVYVTDRDGRAVRGLTQKDFDLFVDGKKVEIVNFSEIAEGSPVPAPEAPPVPQTAGAAPVPQAAPAPEAPPLSLVVFVDNDNLRPFGRNRVLRQLKDFLGSAVGPRDRVMIVTHEQGITVRRPLSPGKESLAADLAKLEKLAARGVIQDSHARSTLEAMQDLTCDRVDEMQQIARAYTQGAENDAKLTLSSLASVVESLSGLEGRKAILYVSDGLEMHPGEQMFELIHELCGGESAVMQVVDLASRFRAVTQLANADGVTFYTLESVGVQNLSNASAEDNPLHLPALAIVNMDLEKRADAQQILFNLASETGGRAVLNGNDIRPDLAKIAGDLRSYYFLGYTPEHSGDGRVHSIEVKVRREGVKVRNRTTYTDRPREAQLAARVQTALLHGVVDNPLQASLALVSSQPEKGKQLVTLRLRLPLKQLVLISQGSVWTGQLTLWVGARDAAGRIAPVQSVKVPVRIPAPPGKDQLSGTFAYDLRMRMAERGEQTVAVGVQDDLGHTTSFITGVFRVDRKGVTAASQSGQ
jgi:VWFA-related protein